MSILDLAALVPSILCSGSFSRSLLVSSVRDRHGTHVICCKFQKGHVFQAEAHIVVNYTRDSATSNCVHSYPEVLVLF